MSMIVTSWPPSSSNEASLAPTRPQPIIKTFIRKSLTLLLVEYNRTGGIFQDVGDHIPQAKLPELPLVGKPHNDKLDPSLYRLVDDCRADLPGLEYIRLDFKTPLFSHALDAVKDI